MTIPRTITYTDSAQVSKATLDAVRDIAHDWHDPSVGHYFIYLREQASITDGSRTGTSEEAGDYITDEDDNSLYDVRGHNSSDDQLIIRAKGVSSGYEWVDVGGSITSDDSSAPLTGTIRPDTAAASGPLYLAGR